MLSVKVGKSMVGKLQNFKITVDTTRSKLKEPLQYS